MTMDAPVQTLADFGLSERTGFMPQQPPLRRLPPYFDAWEDLVHDLSHHLIALSLRPLIQQACHLKA